MSANCRSPRVPTKDGGSVVHISRVVIADDHPLVRRGLRRILDMAGNLRVVAEAADGVEAVSLVRQHKPDAAVLDFEMPKLNGIEVVRWIRQLRSPSKVIVLTMHQHENLVFKAFEAGCLGYVVKHAVAGELTEAISEAVDGRYFLSKALHHLWPDIERRLGITGHDHQ